MPRVSCPFCNAAFALPEVPPTGRAACPRCGEAVPVRARSDDDGDGEPGDGEPRSVTTRALTSPGSPRSPSRRAVTVALLAAGLLGLGIGVFIYSRSIKHTPNPESDAPTTSTTPGELAGLGYLPHDCNLVLAVVPGPLLAYAERTKQDPQEMLAKAGVPNGVFATLGRLGIGLEHIDHIAVGTRLGDAEQELRLAVVLVLRRAPADEEKFLHALDAKKPASGKSHYSVKFAGLPMLLAKVSDRVWLFGLDEKDIALAAAGGKSRLSPTLREMVTERLPAGAAVWAAADSERWAEKPLVKVAVAQALKKPEWLPVLAKGQAAVAGLSFGEAPRLRVAVRCVDGETGAKLRSYFQSKAATDATRTGGEGEWATFDTPADPQNALQPLRQMLEDAGK